MITGASLPSIVGGKYRPLRLIARGGMGAVYEVVHNNTGEHLALKLMSARSLLAPDLVGRFKREARIQSSIKSEHVVRVVDADVAAEIDGAPFIVMELLAGQDFERVCVERQPTAEEAVEWLMQAAQALDKAHRAGIVHRDLKPENLFLATREALPPIVKILDFGIAKLTTDGEQSSTQTGQILGTARYMAPEQAAGAKKVSPAADRFALGLLAFRLLCRRHYFEGDNWVALLHTVTRGPASRPSELGYDRGPAFDAWFARACALDPMQRFATCVEQIEALSNALAGRTLAVRRGSWPLRRARWVAGVGLAVIAVAVWVAVRPRAAVGTSSRTDPAPRAGRAAAVPAASPGPLIAEPQVSKGAPSVVAPSAAPRSPNPRRRGTRVAAGSAAVSLPLAKSEPATDVAKAQPPKDRIWEEP